MTDTPDDLARYDRQYRFAGLGADAQRRLLQARATIIGVGGLGSWLAELLARAGVGFLRLVDADVVEWTNLPRQAMYDEADARAERPKAEAAARRLAEIAGNVRVEVDTRRIDGACVGDVAGDVDLLLDGTDNFTTRFVLNDWAVSRGLPWIFTGVVGGEGQVFPIRPGSSACLRCVYETPPAPEKELRAANAGVLGPAVATIAAIEACEALKILAGRVEACSPRLLRLDLWGNRVQEFEPRRRPDCPCCGQRRFEYLAGGAAP